MPGFMCSFTLRAFCFRSGTVLRVVVVSGAFSTPLFTLAMDGTMPVIRAVKTLGDVELRCVSFDFVEEVVDIYTVFDTSIDEFLTRTT
jgi:hypothetical protein